MSDDVATIEKEVIPELLEVLAMDHIGDIVGNMELINKMKVIPGNTVQLADALIVLCR